MRGKGGKIGPGDVGMWCFFLQSSDIMHTFRVYLCIHTEGWEGKGVRIKYERIGGGGGKLYLLGGYGEGEGIIYDWSFVEKNYLCPLGSLSIIGSRCIYFFFGPPSKGLVVWYDGVMGSWRRWTGLVYGSHRHFHPVIFFIKYELDLSS